MMKVLVAQFHGINCDHDVKTWVEFRGHQAQLIWQTETEIPRDVDLIVIPGGFSFGDYLRCGALAARTPLMKAIASFVKRGGAVLGICNGFQILCEAQLLPGALLANRQGHYLDQWVQLNVLRSTFVLKESKSQMRVPIAHGEGRYFVDQDQMKELEDRQQIWMTYDADINGSLKNIAGISSPDGRVCGMMPHPERAFQDWMGSRDGSLFL